MRIYPFRAVRPRACLAEKVAALPFDVMTTEEARQMAAGNPYSFLRADRAEINLPPGADPYAPEVYALAKSTLDGWLREGALLQDDAPCLYLYRQIRQGPGEVPRTQLGLVSLVSVDDYLQGAIKRHELTRPEKERDRTCHIDVTSAHTGPIFLAYRERGDILAELESFAAMQLPMYDFTTEDGVRQTCWRVSDPATLAKWVGLFDTLPAFYIADGHHRNASAANVAKLRRQEHPDYTGEEEFNRYLAVLFPAQHLTILGYHRLVKGLHGLTPGEFLAKLEDSFIVTPADEPVQPCDKHIFGLYLAGRWVQLRLKPGLVPSASGGPVGRLDASLLQNLVLAPILAIGDPQNDPRLDFVGGIRGLAALEQPVDAGEADAAFSLFPTAMEDLMAVADAGLTMPPKSTWFEPKLRSGLFVHPFEP